MARKPTTAARASKARAIERRKLEASAHELSHRIGVALMTLALVAARLVEIDREVRRG